MLAGCEKVGRKGMPSKKKDKRKDEESRGG
jgi:hypothetical protein